MHPFDAATRRLFALLYHEAFHAYVGTFVYPARPPGDPPAVSDIRDPRPTDWDAGDTGLSPDGGGGRLAPCVPTSSYARDA